MVGRRARTAADADANTAGSTLWVVSPVPRLPTGTPVEHHADMSRFESIVVAFNEGRVEDVVASVTEDYCYSDPTSGRIEGSAGHVALMRQVLERFPDRRIEIMRSWRADAAEFAEYRWTGTPVGGGQPVTMTFAAVIELDGEQMRRFANFQG